MTFARDELVQTKNRITLRVGANAIKSHGEIRVHAKKNKARKHPLPVMVNECDGIRCDGEEKGSTTIPVR